MTILYLANISPFETSRVPVGGKSSVCLICMKYRIIIVIIIIKRLGEILILLSYTIFFVTILPSFIPSSATVYSAV